MNDDQNAAQNAAQKRPRRQLKLDDRAGEVLDNFALLNSLGFAPSVQEVLDRASEVACRHIATMYDQATAKMQKLEP
jgi:predicted nucleic acid-binding protein